MRRETGENLECGGFGGRCGEGEDMLLAGCEDEGADQMRGDLPRGLSGGRVSKEEDVFKLVVQFEKQPLTK